MVSKSYKVICVPQKFQHIREEPLEMWLGEAPWLLWEDGKENLKNFGICFRTQELRQKNEKSAIPKRST